VFQHREDLPQREDFFRSWVEYQLGFGNLTGEFWLGLENIHALVSQTLMELRVDLEDFEGQKRWAKYDFFHVGDSKSKYKLNIGGYSGDAGDSLSKHSGHKFSTKDQDNDIHTSESCAKSHKGAWWFHKCQQSNLNGYPYKGHHDSYGDGINWYSLRGTKYSYKNVFLYIRPKF
ncbi:UNVERIFIED_CONTAM: hypothetical protein GTU68_008734, partial [Idotea baltica]|nr:hypothetical protein [Idotea baltica]